MRAQILVVFGTILSFWGLAQQPEDLGMVNDDLPKGIQVGQTIPFTSDVENTQLLEQLDFAGSEYTVVFFYRGSWCPHCTKHLSSLMDSLQYINLEGAKVIAVTPEIDSASVEDVKAIVGDDLHIILDEGGNIMRWFDVDFRVTEAYQEKLRTRLNTELVDNNHQEDAKLPVPATFIFNSEGIVVWRHFDINYRVRATPTMILKQLASKP